MSIQLSDHFTYKKTIYILCALCIGFGVIKCLPAYSDYDGNKEGFAKTKILCVDEPFAKWAGAGATVPLLGFGNVLYQGVKKAVDAEGFIGLFKGGFSACAVGVSAALIFGYLGSLIFKPKMKD